MLNIDWTVRLGDLLQIAAIGGAGLWMFLTMKSDIRIIRHDLKYLQDQQHTLNEAFSQLGQILTQVAVQDNRLGMIEKNIDEFRHGKGFVK